MKKINLNEVIIQNDSNNNKNDDINKSNYSIYLSKKDLNDIIFSLNVLITDIKNIQNKEYLISQIEKLIFKLKNFDIPPEIQLNTIPTFKTIDIPDMNENINISPFELNLKKLGIDTKTIYSNYEPIDKSKDTNTNKYEGQIINGKKEGKGKYIYKNGAIYEGYFKNDKKEGNGIFYYTNGDRYKGLFKEGFYQGKGIFYFHNGDRYEGEFDKNKYAGKGKYFYHNGDIFEGLWKNDKKNGKGVYIYINGDKIMGNYKDGKPISVHIKYYIDGKVSQIKYSD